MKASNIFPLFQRNNPFVKQATVRNRQPDNTLQKISGQMVSAQENSKKAESQAIAQAARADTYVKSKPTAFDETKRGILTFYMSMMRFHDTIAEMRKEDIMSFKGQLQELDQEIQSYQDIMDGKNTTSALVLPEFAEGSLEHAKQRRAELLEEGARIFSHGGATFIDSYSRIAEKIHKVNPMTGMHASDWDMNLSAPDIYAEIDRVLHNMNAFTGITQQSVAYLDEKLQALDSTHSNSAQDTEASLYIGYFDRQAEDLQKQYEILKDSLDYTGKTLENFINPLDK